MLVDRHCGPHESYESPAENDHSPGCKWCRYVGIPIERNVDALPSRFTADS